MKKRIVALFLVILMACTLLSANAFALKVDMAITENPQSVTVGSGDVVSLTTGATANVGEGEYVYYIWYDPDMTPMDKIIDLCLTCEKNGVVKGSSLIWKLGDIIDLYHNYPSILDGFVVCTLVPNQPTDTVYITAEETRRYQCVAVAYNIDNAQEILDILNSLDIKNLTISSLLTISELLNCEIYGYAMSEPATVTVCEDHKLELVDTVAPTCTEWGYSTYSCAACGNSYVDDYVMPLGHDFGKWEVKTAPTCTEKGEEIRYCSRCDAYKTREIDARHDYAAEVTEPTCTEQGYTTYTCVCGDSYVGDYVDPLGHDYVNGVCTHCGDVTFSIISQPESKDAEVGSNVTFSVAASGNGLTYQWQYKTPTGTKWNTSSSSGAKTAELTIQATKARDGQQYRCVITDASGSSITSDAAVLTVTAAPALAITAQPQSVTTEVGNNAVFSVKAAGSGLTYQWQYKTPTGTKWNTSSSSGAKTAELTIQATKARDGQQYRCVITDASGNKLTSDAAMLTIGAASSFAITDQPQNVTTEVGNNAVFSVKAAGSGLTYQWQYKTPTGTKWNTSSSSGAKTANLTIQATNARDGQQYRCVITDADGNTLTSDAAMLTIGTPSALTITSQPKNVMTEVGNNAIFSVKAAGSGLTYQWQYKTPTGTKWNTSSSSGAKTADLTIQATDARNGQQYRCVITDADGNSTISDTATLTIGTASAIEITTQPKDVTTEVGNNAVFSVEATGSDLTYQWQYKTPTGTKWNTSSSSGAKTAELTIQATTARSGQQYRCVITDANGGSTTSDAATLTVIK